MNDDEIEKLLRSMAAPQLPDSWRKEILGAALGETNFRKKSRPVWPPLLVTLRNLLVRNPITSGALTTLWLLILLFKVSTPVDLSEKEMLTHFDPKRPVYFVSLRDEIKLAELWEDHPAKQQVP